MDTTHSISPIRIESTSGRYAARFWVVVRPGDDPLPETIRRVAAAAIEPLVGPAEAIVEDVYESSTSKARPAAARKVMFDLDVRFYAGDENKAERTSRVILGAVKAIATGCTTLSVLPA